MLPGLMSEQLKELLAQELGVADLVSREGWGSVPSRDCGNLVRLAIQLAEQRMIGSQNPGGGRGGVI